jgi:hypothetical protein
MFAAREPEGGERFASGIKNVIDLANGSAALSCGDGLVSQKTNDSPTPVRLIGVRSKDDLGQLHPTIGANQERTAIRDVRKAGFGQSPSSPTTGGGRTVVSLSASFSS